MEGIIRSFAQHRVAANALMALVIIVGLIALDRINATFFPRFDLDVVNVSANWPGASAEDVQEGYAIPLEEEVFSLTEVKDVDTISYDDGLRLTVTLEDNIDKDDALTTIRDAVNRVAQPDGAEDPEVEFFEIPESVANVVLYGEADLTVLRTWALNAERTLAQAGLSRVEIIGLPEETYVGRVSAADLLERGVTPQSLASQIASDNISTPAGSIGEGGIDRQLRIANEETNLISLANQSLSDERNTRLADLVNLSAEYNEDDTRVNYKGVSAVELVITRGAQDDTLDMANRLQAWQADFSEELPSGLELAVYNETYKFVQSRINIILENGLGGLFLVLIVLFVFLNHRIAFWVAAGIPVAFLGTLFLLELNGETINQISLFGFLIALGIVVDDAIVVAEDAWANVEAGQEPTNAAVNAAVRMFPAVMASSLTTIAAFLPLLLVSGPGGAFSKPIPIVVMMAIAASLIECFLILPGHLAHTLKKRKNRKPNPVRVKIETFMHWLRNGPVRSAAEFSINNRMVTYTTAIMLFAFSISLLVGGKVKFVFLPAIDAPQLILQANFADGTDSQVVEGFMIDALEGLRAVEATAPRPFINEIVTFLNDGSPYSARLVIELDASSERPLSNDEIASMWRERVERPDGLLSYELSSAQIGPGSTELAIQLAIDDLEQLRDASTWLQNELALDGRLIEIDDDLPTGSDQWSVSLLPEAKTLGLTNTDLASQLRNLTNGVTAQTLRIDGQTQGVKVQLNNDEVSTWLGISAMPIALPNGDNRPLAAVAQITSESRIARLNRKDGQLTAVVNASIASDDLSLNEIGEEIKQTLIPELESRFGVEAKLGGDQETQADFVRDVQIGTVVGLLLIFGILAWVFESWSWPLAVKSVIPFALTGALLGHWALGLDFSVLSVYGIFGLSGIIINDSIVLIRYYKELREKGWHVHDAVIEATTKRFRPVLITSLTTISGLIPLLFESSFDAQFLIPLAAGLAFGLAYGVFLILFMVPALLTTIERWRGQHGNLLTSPQ